MNHIHIGNYLKQLVVNQGFTIKDFSKIYGTTEGYMGDIFAKEDVSTKVLRGCEEPLNTSFVISCSLDNLIGEGANEESANYSIKKSSGRPISLNVNDLSKNSSNFYLKEIESLKAQLKLKDDLLRSKDEVIMLLNKIKN